MINTKHRAINLVSFPTAKEDELPMTCAESVYEILKKNRFRTAQVYERLPHFNPRTVREALLRLKMKKIIKKDKCECGLETLWTVI